MLFDLWERSIAGGNQSPLDSGREQPILLSNLRDSFLWGSIQLKWNPNRGWFLPRSSWDGYWASSRPLPLENPTRMTWSHAFYHHPIGSGIAWNPVLKVGGVVPTRSAPKRVCSLIQRQFPACTEGEEVGQIHLRTDVGEHLSPKQTFGLPILWKFRKIF